jgi:hypothetical protein
MSHDTTDANQDSNTVGGAAVSPTRGLLAILPCGYRSTRAETRTSNDETRKHEREKIHARA